MGRGYGFCLLCCHERRWILGQSSFICFKYICTSPIIWDYYDIEEEAIEEAKELNEYVNKGDAYYYVSKALGVAVASNGFESLGKISRDYSRSNIYTDIAYRNDFKGNQEFLARAGFTYYFK